MKRIGDKDIGKQRISARKRNARWQFVTQFGFGFSVDRLSVYLLTERSVCACPCCCGRSMIFTNAEVLTHVSVDGSVENSAS